MKTSLRVLLALLLTVVAAAAEPPKTLRVLFIGNSLTSKNDLPGILTAMASASGRTLTCGRNLVGGAALEKHWADGKALAKIKGAEWDYVVLQDFSAEAYKNRDSMFRHGHLFNDEIKQAKAKTVLYMTWALETDQDKFSVIEEAYRSLGKELKSKVVPAGSAWRTALADKALAGTKFYVPDHKHPTYAGSYLAACEFYRVLFETPSATLPPMIGGQSITKEEAATLQKVADSVPLAEN